MNDWIEWNGGECPVAAITLVDLKFRGGQTTDPARKFFAYTWNWSHRGDHYEFDIVAYRLHQEGHYEEQPDGAITPVDPADMQAPEVTGDWVMVPREPTEDMIAHAFTAAVTANVFVVGQFKSAEAQERVLMAAVYKAMLSAAPSAASAIQAAVREKLEEAANEFEGRIKDTDNPYDNALQYCANRIRALMEPKS